MISSRLMPTAPKRCRTSLDSICDCFGNITSQRISSGVSVSTRVRSVSV